MSGKPTSAVIAEVLDTCAHEPQKYLAAAEELDEIEQAKTTSSLRRRAKNRKAEDAGNQIDSDKFQNILASKSSVNKQI